MADEEAAAPAPVEEQPAEELPQQESEVAPEPVLSPEPPVLSPEPAHSPPAIVQSEEVVEEHSAVREQAVAVAHHTETTHHVTHESRSSSSMSTSHVTTSVMQQLINHVKEEVHQEQATMLTSWPPVRSPTPRAVVVGLQNIDLTLNKEEGQHWGFRLGGGKEFGMPLSVNRVQLGGLAEQQGFLVGDVVEQINGMPTSEMTHQESLDAINKAGNKCLFTIIRGQLATGKVPRPIQTMAPLQDLTTAQPIIGVNPGQARPLVAAKAAMRNMTLGNGELNAQQTDTCFTEEVIAETMTSHAEIVAGNALGVNFHKFEPKYEHLAMSSVYQMLLEEESRRGKPMTMPRPRKPEIVSKKQQPKAKEPTPPPKEPTPPPKEPTPPPKEPTPPPRELTPPPEEPSQEEEALVAEQEPEYLEAEEPQEQPLTNGVNGLDEEDEELAAAAAAAEEEAERTRQVAAQAEAEAQAAAQAAAEAAAAAAAAAKEAEVKAYYQRQHEERLTKERQEALQAQIAHKMKMEECRRRINHAQRTIYTPTITPEEVVQDCTTGMERKLPKAGCRYRPALPLTPAAPMHSAFPTKPEAFAPFQARAPPVFQPTVNGIAKPMAKPASAVQCVIPMNWHPPSQLVNGQPYKYQPTHHEPAKQLPDQEFLPPAQPKPNTKPAPVVQESAPQLIAQPPQPEARPRSPKPVAHPLQPVPIVAKHNATGPQPSEDEIAEMMSANTEVIVGQTLGVNFQKFMPGFDHLQNSAVYRMVHGLEE